MKKYLRCGFISLNCTNNYNESYTKSWDLMLRTGILAKSRQMYTCGKLVKKVPRTSRDTCQGCQALRYRFGGVNRMRNFRAHFDGEYDAIQFQRYALEIQQLYGTIVTVGDPIVLTRKSNVPIDVVVNLSTTLSHSTISDLAIDCGGTCIELPYKLRDDAIHVLKPFAICKVRGKRVKVLTEFFADKATDQVQDSKTGELIDIEFYDCQWSKVPC